jgi:predicted dehydrogenase
MLKVGVIGYGYWGPNLVRVFNQAKDSTVVAVADKLPANRAKVEALYPKTVTHDDARAVINDPTIDVVAVATPVSTHYELAAAALNAGKHVLVEKPLCGSLADAERLVELAAKKNRQILADHTFVYTGAVRKIGEMSDRGELGRILYYDSTRINLGLFQHDVNVIWDLAVHDFAILQRIMPEQPTAISAQALDPLGAGGSSLASVAYVTLFYPGNTVAHVHASWLAPVKIRQVIVGGDKSMVVYDDLSPAEKIRIYDKGVEFVRDPVREHAMRVEYRIGDMRAPVIDTTEALVALAKHANECFAANKPPVTSGEVGMRIVKLLELADRSAQQSGAVLSVS